MLRDFIRSTKELKIYNIVILQKGVELAKYDWIIPKRHNQYSITKSVTSIAVGIAIDEGLISLGDKVYSFFPERKNINPQMTIRHLLTMTNGEAKSNLMSDEREKLDSRDWINHAFNCEVKYQVGNKFVYTNTAPYILAMIISKVTKRKLKDYVQAKIFSHLNIRDEIWEEDFYGNQFAASGLRLTTQELSRFGQMLLEKGKYRGKKIVSSEWVSEAAKQQVITGEKGDDYNRYGYYFWPSKHNAYRADGKFGQFCIVINDKDAVIAINSNEERSDMILQNVWQNIYNKL